MRYGRAGKLLNRYRCSQHDSNSDIHNSIWVLLMAVVNNNRGTQMVQFLSQILCEIFSLNVRLHFFFFFCLIMLILYTVFLKLLQPTGEAKKKKKIYYMSKQERRKMGLVFFFQLPVDQSIVAPIISFFFSWEGWGPVGKVTGLF